jgi:FAD/FMN-containing dehydrogenase
LLEYGEEHASPWPELFARDDDPPLLYLGYEGFAEEVEASWTRARRILGVHGAVERPQSEAESFWQHRHVIAQRFARGMPRERRFGSGDMAREFMHVALPPSQVLRFREDIHAMTASEGVALLDCGLWTAPDFFSSGLTLPNSMGGVERLSQVMDMLLRHAQELGGSMEYVHGAGMRLAHLMPEEHGEALEVIRRIKAAIDPSGVLNPGKLGL